MCCDLDYLPRGVARRAPELQDVPTELVGEAKNGGDDRVGIARAAGPRATAEDQIPQSQDAFAGLPSIRGPRAARRADGREQVPTSNPVLVLS